MVQAPGGMLLRVDLVRDRLVTSMLSPTRIDAPMSSGTFNAVGWHPQFTLLSNEIAAFRSSYCQKQDSYLSVHLID